MAILDDGRKMDEIIIHPLYKIVTQQDAEVAAQLANCGWKLLTDYLNE